MNKTLAQKTILETQNGPHPRSIAEGARERLLAQIPLNERRLDLAGISTAVLEGGDGPPIVFLHGPGEYAAKWIRVIPDLVKTHHVVAPDLPGHGSSVVPGSVLRQRDGVAWQAARAYLLGAAGARGANPRRRHSGQFRQPPW